MNLTSYGISIGNFPGFTKKYRRFLKKISLFLKQFCNNHFPEKDPHLCKYNIVFFLYISENMLSKFQIWRRIGLKMTKFFVWPENRDIGIGFFQYLIFFQYSKV